MLEAKSEQSCSTKTKAVQIGNVFHLIFRLSVLIGSLSFKNKNVTEGVPAAYALRIDY